MAKNSEHTPRRGSGLWLLLPIVLAAVVSAVAVCSCVSEECYDNKNSLPLAGFYSSDSIPEAISLDSISILGLGAPGDSILHDSVRNISQSYLPFRIDRDETQYEIKYLQGLLGKFRITDTITFRYKIVPWFVSGACGAVYKYEDLEIATTHNIIDSVVCPLGIIDNANVENLRIYFRVSKEGGEE